MEQKKKTLSLSSTLNSNILSFCTATKTASVALSVKNEITVLSSYGYKGHSTVIMQLCDDLLRKNGLNINDIDLFAVTNGPGSYTGLRIGVSAVKGLAWTGEKPCVGISTLEALANSCKTDLPYIRPVLDARNNQGYTALFENRNGIRRLKEDELLSFDLLEKSNDVYFVGDTEFSNPPSETAEGAIKALKNKEILNCFELSVNYVNKTVSGFLVN